MKKKESVTIGKELKEILDRKGMTSYRLAKDLGIGQSYLSRLFKDRFNPSYGLVKKIAQALGYEIRFVKSRKKGGGSFR
jgi:transcriptional regulator with XRE-family HTH domain